MSKNNSVCTPRETRTLTPKGYWVLSPAWLPIPPLRRFVKRSFWHNSVSPIAYCFIPTMSKNKCSRCKCTPFFLDNKKTPNFFSLVRGFLKITLSKKNLKTPNLTIVIAQLVHNHYLVYLWSVVWALSSSFYKSKNINLF